MKKAVRIPPSHIESVKVSPLNEHRWRLHLDCGHDAWVTAKRRPTRSTIVCPSCLDNLAEGTRGETK